MIDYNLILAVVAGIGLLFLLILYFKVQAFVALLICSIAVGLLAGLPPAKIMESIQSGMASTLGFVAVIVGLGALFGAILQHSGGVDALAAAILNKTGERKAPWALVATGFMVSIPVFFDVGFIILAPVLYALQKKTSKSLLLYAVPLLAGLAVSHAFIPPTPGPVVVADILGANLSTVMITGAIAGIPAAIVAGPLYGRFISKRVYAASPEFLPVVAARKKLPSATTVALLIFLPISLILLNTFLTGPHVKNNSGLPGFANWLPLLGHPFMALLIANLLAWYLLGIRQGFSKTALLDISSSSLAPAGLIILITGAGGVFKEMLTVTGAGKMIAVAMEQYHFPAILFAFLTALAIRILQGSTTVAMITSAGMTAAFIESIPHTGFERALLVTAIASGAMMFSHVNDSGFWLVSKYLGLTEKQTLSSWTVSSTLIGITAFLIVLLIHFFI